MKVPLSWLRSYCDPGLSLEELGDRLASIGLQPERIDHVGVGDTSAFVVGRVLSCEKHPDAVCVYGVARDVHAFSGAPLAEDPTAGDVEPSGSDSAEDHVSVTIDPEVCLRFTARAFEEVKIGPSPLWLKQRLMAAGQRPI